METQTMTITSDQLAKLLGIDASQGIFDLSMDAWDGPECVIKIQVCDKTALVSAGLH